MAQNGRSAISAFLYKLNPFKSEKNSKDVTQSNSLTQSNQNNSSIAEAKLEKDVKSEDNSSICEVKLEKNVKSEDNLSPQVLKQKQCPWLISFLCTKSYFDDCPKHDIPKKDCRLNYFCIYCPQAGPLCISCMEEEHKDHKFVRINRCAKTAAVKESEAHCIDSSMVYPYMLSGEPAYFLRSDRPFKPIRRCVVCERVLRGKKIKTWWNMESKKRKKLNKMVNDRNDAIYCSLMCKLKGVLRANGKPRLSTLIHNDDYGGAVWGKRLRVEKDRKQITWESESDQIQNLGEKQSGIPSNTEDNDEEGAKNVEEEKNQEPKSPITDNHGGPNSNDKNILDRSDVDRDIKRAKFLFDDAHVDGNKVSYSQIISDEDIVDLDEAMRSHNPSQILFDNDETMRSLNQTSSEDNDDGDSSEDTFDDYDDDSSEDNNDDDDSSEDNDDKKTISSLSENVSDDEIMSYSNQAVPVDHIDETINTEHESSRDGISDSNINDDEVEDETDQGSDNELTDDDLDHDKKLCDYTNLSRDKLELLVSERDPLTSDKSFKEGNPMSSNQHSFDDTKETDNAHNNHNTNSSLVSTATETSKEKTIEIGLLKSTQVQTKNSKQSDQNKDEFQDNEKSDIDQTYHIVEPKQDGHNEYKFQDNKTNDIDKIDHTVEPKQGDHNQDNENNGIDKIDQIVAEDDEVETVKGFKDNDKVDHIVAQANETNKLIEDNGKGEDKKLHTSDMEVLTDSIKISLSGQKAIPAMYQAKTFSGHVHKRECHIMEEEQEEHKQYKYEAHYLNHDLYHVPQFGNDDGRKENKNTNDPLRSDMDVQTDNIDSYPVANVYESRTMEVQTDNIDNYPVANVHESRTIEVQTDNIDTYPEANAHESRTMEVQTDNMDTYPVANVHESRTIEVQTDNIDAYPEVNIHESGSAWKRRRLSNSSPKPLATVTIDIYSPGKTYYS